MLNNKKILIKRLISSVFFRYFKQKYGFFGNYKSWDEAKKDSIGYDSNIILEKVKNSLLKVKNGIAVYERDSVLFDKIQYSWPLLSALLYIALEKKGNLCVLDFGGSLGSSYFQNKILLEGVKNLKWHIVEQQKFVDYGKEYFEDDVLKFYYDIKSCIKFYKPDVILISSTLQYIEKPYEVLDEILSYNFEYIIFDRTTFIFDNNIDILKIQKVPPKIYSAIYPVWFFNYYKFLSIIEKKYKLIADFDSLAGTIYLDKLIAKDKGFIFKIKS